jgi:hypothetical protein
MTKKVKMMVKIPIILTLTLISRPHSTPTKRNATSDTWSVIMTVALNCACRSVRNSEFVSLIEVFLNLYIQNWKFHVELMNFGEMVVMVLTSVAVVKKLQGNKWTRPKKKNNM